MATALVLLLLLVLPLLLLLSKCLKDGELSLMGMIRCCSIWRSTVIVIVLPLLVKLRLGGWARSGCPWLWLLEQLG